MRAVDCTGRLIERPATAEERARFVHALGRNWAGNDPRRRRILAVWQLRAAGWTYSDIVTALGIARGTAHKYARIASEGLSSIVQKPG